MDGLFLVSILLLLFFGIILFEVNSRKEVFLEFTWLTPSCFRNPFQDSPERRCSSRTFRYGYLVTT